MSKQILVVDDDVLMRRSVGFALEQVGYGVVTTESAESALAIIRRNPPDLVLLDIGLPNMDGLAALRHIQQESHIPVIFVSARRRDLDAILGLELGADDYITKPFNMDVLLARVKAVLRRGGPLDEVPPSQQPLQIGDLSIDPAAHVVNVGTRTLDPLPPREFALLHALALDAGRVLSVDDLLARVWGAEFMGEPQVVYVHIRWLRERLEEDPSKPQRIVTVRGVGYKLVASRF
jgi:DNA-binding response OmpR family regulator